MSKLTFGVEMEIFIKSNLIMEKIIENEMAINNCNTIQELIDFVVKQTTYFDFIKLKDGDDEFYITILILTYIISKNSKNISFSLNNIAYRDIIYFKDFKHKFNWHYDIDYSVYPVSEKTYRTIFDNFPRILSIKELLPYTEFVSPIFDNTEEVKKGVGTLISSLTDLKLTPLHSSRTSNHIHFSIKKETDDEIGIKDPYLIFCITYVFYILQNLFYLICLPERRTSVFCTPLKIEKHLWSKRFDDFTLNEFFNIPITMKKDKDSDKGIDSDEYDYDEEVFYLDRSEIERLSMLFLKKSNNIKLTNAQILKRTENLRKKIDKLRTPSTDVINKPFRNLTFEHQLMVLMHFYHKRTTYKMNTDIKKYTIDIKGGINVIGRYKILNLKKLSLKKSCTLELRVKHGSNDSIEIGNFCILIEKFVNIAEKMVLNKDMPLLKSLANILNIDEKELFYFKEIEPKDLQKHYTHLHYTNVKPLLKKILKSLFKEDNISIKYWMKQLKRINDPKDKKDPKSLIRSKGTISSTYSLSSKKQTL
jgi:hypothetical protein